MPISFRLTSYNVLAAAYATRKLYPSVDPELMRWSRRAPAIVARVVALAPDVACLQEVEAAAWPELEAAFAAHRWHGVFVAKGAGRPDGCALLHQDGTLRFAGSETLHCGVACRARADSGHRRRHGPAFGRGAVRSPADHGATDACSSVAFMTAAPRVIMSSM